MHHTLDDRNESSDLLRRFAPVKAEPPAAALQGKLITVFSLALVDLVLTSGQSTLMLNLLLRHSWAELTRADAHEIDANLLDSVLLAHPSGTRVLATPSRPEQSELLGAGKVAHALGLLRERAGSTAPSSTCGRSRRLSRRSKPCCERYARRSWPRRSPAKGIENSRLPRET